MIPRTPTIPRIPSSLLVERMRCTLGECPAHFDGVYQFRLNGLLVRAPQQGESPGRGDVADMERAAEPGLPGELPLVIH